jgi:hypothetical protein
MKTLLWALALAVIPVSLLWMVYGTRVPTLPGGWATTLLLLVVIIRAGHEIWKARKRQIDVPQ